VTPGTPNFPLHADREVMDPTKRNTFDFLEDFFDEVVQVFPDEYVHLGMDEVRSTHAYPLILPLSAEA
jgi:hexosaminidase